MALKEELKQQAGELGIKLEGSETNAELQNLIDVATGNTTAPEAKTEKPTAQAPIMVPLSDVKTLIAEALAKQAEDNKPVKLKRVTEHFAHVWRFDGQWVIDFVNRNRDPYVTKPVFAFNKYNAEKKENEAWIEIKLAAALGVDGKPREERTLELPLNRYIERRVLVYCPIIKRHKKDVSYSFGEIEKKVEDSKSGMLKGTGIMIDQEVVQYAETFEVKTPDGEVRMIPDYAIN